MYGSGIQFPKVSFSSIDYTQIPADSFFTGFDLDNGGVLSKIDSTGTITVIEGASSLNYKVYTALLTQSGTDTPVATVLENTLGGIPVWTRNTIGTYTITLAGAFPITKTFCFLTITGNGDTDGRIITEINYAGAPNDNQRGFVIKNAATNLNSDGIGANSCIEIRVYN